MTSPFDASVLKGWRARLARRIDAYETTRRALTSALATLDEAETRAREEMAKLESAIDLLDELLHPPAPMVPPAQGAPRPRITPYDATREAAVALVQAAGAAGVATRELRAKLIEQGYPLPSVFGTWLSRDPRVLAHNRAGMWRWYVADTEPVDSTPPPLSPRSRQIMQIIAEAGELSVSDVAERLNRLIGGRSVSRQYVWHTMRQLADRGVLRRDGNKYRVVEPAGP